ncbi:MAG: hypothetical protein AB8F26_09805, partial [Phycisphaerales bacterium]
ECVSPGPGTGAGAVCEPEGKLNQGRTYSVPVDKYQLRMTSAIHTKQVKLQEYMQQGIIGDDDVALIALNSTNIALIMADMDPPHIARCMLGLGTFAVDFSYETNEFGRTYLTEATEIKRAAADPIPANGFDLDELKHVSAVVYSHGGLWNFRGDPRDHLVGLPNPNTSRPLDSNHLSRINRWERHTTEAGRVIRFSQRVSRENDSEPN